MLTFSGQCDGVGGWLILIAILLLSPLAGAREADKSCLMCHKYPGLGRVDQGIERAFYVNEDLYQASYHGQISCHNCHLGVDRIPHTDAKKVDCASDCHLNDPSTGRPFSHKHIVQDLAASAHGRELFDPEKQQDLPNCKDCHSNKTYHNQVKGLVGPMDFKGVCLECHGEEGFVERFYEHVIYRSNKRRSSQEVVALCSRCHADAQIMDRHDVDVVVGFQDTFHAKAIAYGDEAVANCLSCHAPYQLGFSPHRILSRHQGDSPVHRDNKLQTCSQSGCHSEANERFASGGRIHPSDIRKQSLVVAGPLQTTPEGSPEAAFQATVLTWIEWFYKILIAGVVGGLGMHRLLDMYATRREHRYEKGQIND